MSDLIDPFESLIARLPGLDCWNVMAGAVGSMASLDLGAKIARDQPLPYPNVKLTPEEHKFRGEVVLYLENCPWRLDGFNDVIASWNDHNGPKGRLVQGLRSLIGAQVRQAEISRPGLDLIVRFSSGHTLRIFPDTTEDDDADNYSLSAAGGQTFIVGPCSRLRVE
jgi:hypothetical protein